MFNNGEIAGNDTTNLFGAIFVLIICLIIMLAIALNKLAKKYKLVLLFKKLLMLIFLFLFLILCGIFFSLVELRMINLLCFCLFFIGFLAMAINPKIVVGLALRLGGEGGELNANEAVIKILKQTGSLLSLILFMGIVIFALRHFGGYENEFLGWLTNLFNQISLKLFGVII